MLRKESLHCNKERMGARTPFYFYLAMLMLMMASFLSNSHVNAAFNITFQFHVTSGAGSMLDMENVQIWRYGRLKEGSTTPLEWISFFNSRKYATVLAGGYYTLQDISMPDDNGKYYVSMDSWPSCFATTHSCESKLFFDSTIAGKVVRAVLGRHACDIQRCNPNIVVI